MIMSLELWIFSGETPDDVKYWFYHDKGYNDEYGEAKI
jgi:hypothetical protein